MQLVIYFLGSGITSLNQTTFHDEFWSYANHENSALMIVAGCQHEQVADSFLFPDLKKFAERFTQTLFLKSDNNTFVLDKATPAGVGVLYENYNPAEAITGITLCGNSRGAVTCFEVARQLNTLAPELPVDIVADQPVPGNVYQSPYSNAASISDCRDLTNVANTAIILGAYTAESKTANRSSFFKQPVEYISNVGEKLFHLAFFSQIVPQLSAKTNRELIVIPEKMHDTVSHNQIHLHVAKSLLRRSVTLENNEDYQKDQAFKQSAVENRTAIAQNGHISYAYSIKFRPQFMGTSDDANSLTFYLKDNSIHYTAVSSSREVIKDQISYKELGLDLDIFYSEDYTKYTQGALELKLRAKLPEILKIISERGHIPVQKNIKSSSFPQVESLQRIFGMNTEQLYHHTDRLHPAPYLRAGFEWSQEEALVDWWNKLEQSASRFSTNLTKQLITVIHETNVNDVDSMINLFEASDRWLILKENSSTSRYSQVLALRDTIFHRLVEMGVDQSVLMEKNRALLKEENYFLSHWTNASAAASYFKTEETIKLDEAFAAHSKDEISNEALLAELDEWLEKKQTSNSKRYDLVINIREKLRLFASDDANTIEQPSIKVEL